MRATAVLVSCLIGASTLASPALADVRAGVDAWSRGDYTRAIREWQGAAAKGDPDAQFNMAQAYKLGRGVTPDLKRAEELYRAAAEQGHARAADNYGLLLFQTERQREAMPWLEQSALRGEPRAQYLVGIAAFNGDYAPKDWIRAYALMTRAAATGLPQAVSGLAVMNQAIPLQQRQLGTSLAGDLDRRAEQARATQLGAADLGAMRPPLAGAPLPTPAPSVSAPVASPAYTHDPSRPVATGADYASPVTLPPRARRPSAAGITPAAISTAAPAPRPAKPSATGPWRVQLGAFGQKANADALWARVRTRPEIAGHARIDLSSGGVTRLQAGGYASEGEAARACAALKAGGASCLVVKP
ncbi:SPOR domain-containing protein [Novosphingobium sp. KCTC 2891]|uniref:SPOR domain-containing protein n=1 Tax=Novosphingobium sp. KCTC 2891 TaxID=2989730 RepID=UPI0022233F98|nr:SPOR domain-containing protein [Novosphingobium sp. KCTC 2891]MCW1382975.1 SPOR domain-containing protein [Novosphingobium sp. KCTC 2891]